MAENPRPSQKGKINLKPRTKLLLVFASFALFTAIALGLFVLATLDLSEQARLGFDYPVWVIISFLAGLSMIFLPCTLPIAFLLVPLAMKESPKKGLAMALSFGAGLVVTLALYGVFVSIIGKYLGLDQVTQLMFLVGGVMAFAFGLSELKLLKWELPALNVAQPPFLKSHGAVLGSFFLGLFLGNAGIGCPNPAFYSLLLYIGASGSAEVGASLGLVHGLGRFLPLLLLVVLALAGLNYAPQLTKKRALVQNLTGWGLVIFGAFTLQIGLFGMWSWETSPVHLAWNEAVDALAPQLGESAAEPLITGVQLEPSPLEKLVPGIPWISFFLLLGLTWAWKKTRGEPQ